MFRQKFIINTKMNHWFPGHMIKGRNTQFMRSITSVKPHILIMNKNDKIDDNFKTDINRRVLNHTCNRVIYTNCNRDNCENIDTIVPTINDLLSNRSRYHRENNLELNVMTVGIPNVGKSTVINKLREVNLRSGGKPMNVGPIAGVTRAVSERLKISYDPPIYLFDTPGVLEPLITGPECALRLALCGTFADYVIGEELIADYLLFWLNKRRIFHYVNVLDLDGPCDDINKVLIQIAIKKNYIVNTKNLANRKLEPRPDMLKAAQFFVSKFRSCELGKLLLDDDILYKEKTVASCQI